MAFDSDQHSRRRQAFAKVAQLCPLSFEDVIICAKCYFEDASLRSEWTQGSRAESLQTIGDLIVSPCEERQDIIDSRTFSAQVLEWIGRVLETEQVWSKPLDDAERLTSSKNLECH